MQSENILYDGSFDGFLSCVFYAFERKLKDIVIQVEGNNQNQLFSENTTIISNNEKADRVWKGLKAIAPKDVCTKIYYAFLSEQQGVENLLLNYIKYIFKTKGKSAKDYTYYSVLQTSKIAKNVAREKHRMEAFVRFRLTKDNTYFSNIEPDFNVLPLISKHFKSRYADQKWIIYDIKRKYGIYYDLDKLDFIQLDFPKNFNFSKTDANFFAEEEYQFQKLWQLYFKSTNIKARKNMKLHVRHVPKRYWKYLSEKQPNLDDIS